MENKVKKFRANKNGKGKGKGNNSDFLKRKTKRDEIKSNLGQSTEVKPQYADKISQIEVIFRKAKALYENKSAEFDLDKEENMKNKDKKWTADLLKSGTLEDKISALALYIKKNPLKCLKYVDLLIRMAKKKNRRQTEACIIVLKDIFLDDLLTNKKLATFYTAINNSLKVENGIKESAGTPSTSSLISLPDDKIVQLYVEDFIHKKYTELLEIIQDIIVNDPLKAMKKKYLNILLEMIKKRPEKEEKIIDLIINKLGDPEVEISNFTIKLLKDLQLAHPKMSLIIFKNIQNFFSKISEPKNPGKFYALVSLTHMSIINDKDFLEYSLEYFFDLFNYYANISEEESHIKRNWKKNKVVDDQFSVNKFLSLIVKRVNMICKFSSERNIPISKLLDEKIDTLFRLSHSSSIKLRVEVLKLVFMICKGIIQGNQGKGERKAKEGEASIDRYYKSLYEILLMKETIFSKHLRELLKLIMMSLSFDTNLSRVAAFLKRLLQMCLLAEPSFITCILIITSQILRNKHKLWKMLEKSENSTRNEKPTENSEISYDFTKRDPKYTSADTFPIAEIHILRSHYHPTVQRFTNFILENYNKDVVSYEGDPLIDFSLVNFLEKFMLKNPRIKKDKVVRKSKADQEEEDLKKFLGEDEKKSEPIVQVGKAKTGTEMEFIKIFNEIEKVKSVKYEKNQEKKKKKFVSEETGEDDIEEFADQVVEKEYEKYDKDIDEDMEDVDEDEPEDEAFEEEDFEDIEDVEEAEQGDGEEMEMDDEEE